MAEQPMQVMTAFPTYVGSKQWSDTDKLNDGLRRAIWQNKGANPDGLYRSNAAGTWHSDDACLKWMGDAGKQLGQMFGNAFRTYINNAFGADEAAECTISLQAWAMVYSPGGYATVHTHPNCHLSGVYYVDGGDDSKSIMATGVNVHPGDIEFVNPGPPCPYQFTGMTTSRGFRINPDAGQMLVFPSNLPHFVHPVKADERISIACNATIKRFKPPVKMETPNDPDK